MVIQKDMVYIVNGVYWLCVNDDPRDLQWERLDIKKPMISVPSIVLPENPHE